MKKVLILEDEENIRSFVVINLKRAGYEAIEAGTGMEAFAVDFVERSSVRHLRATSLSVSITSRRHARESPASAGMSSMMVMHIRTHSSHI